jgi:flagellar biosynthesis protein FliQ
MAIEKVIDIKIQGNADEAVGSLRSQLRAAQADVAELSAKFGATSQQAVEAAKRAGQLKDQIGDAKALTDAFNPDAKFKALSSSLAGVAGGFAAVQGGMALFGAESAEVEKTLLKVQSAMALSQGLQQIGESVDSFKQLGAVIKSLNIVQVANNFIQTGSIALKKEDVIATAAQSTATVAATAATSAATTGMKLLRLAIIGTGIGALVVGLIALYQNFDKVKEVVLNFIPGLASVGKFIGGIIDSVTDFVGATSDASRALDTMREAADKSLALNKKYLEQQGDQLDEFTKKKIDAKNRYLEALKDEGNSEKDRVELAKRLNRELAAADKEREDEREKKRIAAEKKAAEDAKKEELTDAEKKAKIKELNKKFNEENDKIQGDFDVTSLENLDAANQAKREKDAKFKEDQIAAEQQFQLQTAQIIYDSETARDERAEEARQRRIEQFQLNTDAVASIAKSGENLLASIQANGLARGKAGQAAMKALALVQIGADSAIAFSKMMQGTEQSAAGAASGAPGPAAPAVYLATKIAFYATGTATILANIARAKALLSGGGGGGGAAPSMAGAGGGGGGGAAPQFNVVGNSGVNQLAGIMATNEQTPVKAYVVPSDVTTGQSLDRNIIRNASLG